MIASLYQRDVSGAAAAAGATTATGAVSSNTPGPSEEVVEIALGARRTPYAEYVRGHPLRIEQDVVARTVPHVTRVGQQVMHLERVICVDAERLEIEHDPAGLRVVRVEID